MTNNGFDVEAQGGQRSRPARRESDCEGGHGDAMIAARRGWIAGPVKWERVGELPEARATQLWRAGADRSM